MNKLLDCALASLPSCCHWGLPMISLSRPSGVNAPGSGHHAPAFLSPRSLLAGKGGLFGRRPRRADGALGRLLEEVIVTLRTEEEAWAIGRGRARDRPGQKE